MNRVLSPWLAAACVAALVTIQPAFAAQDNAVRAMQRLPVREVTAFKDGHAFVLHEGTLPTDSHGNVVLDYLPSPVLGTFWPYSKNKQAKLSAVTAGQRRIQVTRTALGVRELLESNVGAEITFRGGDGIIRSGTIVAVPVRSGQELEATSPPGGGDKLPEKGAILVLKMAEGTYVTPIDRIGDVTFKQPNRGSVTTEEFRNLLTMKLEWPDNKPAKQAEVGMVYVQRGVRWIPSYKVRIDGAGKAHVMLRATLINDLTDLNDVAVNLVIGVPSFAFADQQDPIALQQTMAAVAYANGPGGFGGGMGGALSNSIMTQARFGEARDGNNAGRPQGPEVEGSAKSEDLFVFAVKHVTLKKGERMSLPVAEFDVTYRDVYTLDIPIAPPMQVTASFNQQQQTEVAKMLRAARVHHKLRFTNTSKMPFTTAPVLLMKGDDVLSQGLMTYTSPGNSCDVDLTTAIDVVVKRVEKETGRTPNAATFQTHSYGRIDLGGTITLKSSVATPIDVEVSRYVLGHAGKAEPNGTATMLSLLGDDDEDQPISLRAQWWSWYNLPNWFNSLNGLAKFTWKARVEPGKDAVLTYAWHYFWE